MTALPLHEANATASQTLRPGAIARDDRDVLDTWSELVAEFLDRRAARRLQYYAEAHAGYRWKPKLALVLPAEFSVLRRSHRRDLAVALEVIATVSDHYNLSVVSDSPDASRLFRKVTPFSHNVIASCVCALVLLSRTLNDEVSAICPSRHVGADPCSHRINKKRIVFTAGGVRFPFALANEREIAREVHGCLSVFVDEDEETPLFLGTLRRLRMQGLPLRLTLSSRTDEDFARQVNAAFDDDHRVEVRDPDPLGLDDHSEIQVSNEPIVLLSQRKSTVPRFLFRKGRLWRVGASIPCRSDFYLFRGEESNSHGVLSAWLRRPEHAEPQPASPQIAGTVEPLVSIVVPIYDRTSEIIRMAHSIYAQEYPWIEVVFVSNGSPPETIEAIRTAENHLMKRRFRVHIIELDRAYGSATVPRDLGIRASSGDVICVLDSDDWLEPGFFAFLSSTPWRSDTLYYPRRFYHNHGREMWEGFPYEQTVTGMGTLESSELVSALESNGNFMNNSGVCFSRALFDRAGGIDHRIIYGEDFYLWMRAAIAGGRAQEHDGCVNISLHPGNNELLVGERRRAEEASELARSQELTQWL